MGQPGGGFEFVQSQNTPRSLHTSNTRFINITLMHLNTHVLDLKRAEMLSEMEIKHDDLLDDLQISKGRRRVKKVK